jgi:hypothetical protein
MFHLILNIPMRFFLVSLLLITFIPGYSLDRPDSTKSKLTISGSFSINSNGIASIPAFSLGKPAMMGSFTLQKKRFSYDPVIAYGLNMRPWIIDNWLHYRLIYTPKFELRTGVDFAMFFSNIDSADFNILQGQQYITAEIAGVFRFTPKNSLSVMYWSDNGQDHGTIDGHFYNIMYDHSDIEIGKSVLLAVNVQVFYIDYTGKNDGLFVAPRLASAVKKVPLSLFFQATQPVTSNVEPWPGFKWNIGLGYLF